MFQGKKEISSIQTVSDISDNTFFLKNIMQRPTEPVYVSFTPTSSPSQSDFQDGDSDKLNYQPVFNHDNNFFTPSFVLDADKAKCLKHYDLFAKSFEKKRLQIIDQSQQIMVPRPSEHNSYCSVCKIKFQDYLAHIMNEEHQKKMKGSKFEKHIHKLCKQFTIKTPKRSPKQPKTKNISKAKKTNNINTQNQRVNLAINKNHILAI